MPLQPGTTIGRYLIEERLPDQLWWTDYLAFDGDLERRVLLRCSLHDQRREQELLLNEGRNLSQLRHPSIPNVYDTVGFEDEVYYVHELIEGESLGDVLQKETLSRSRLVDLIIQVTDAVHYAHRRGVLHRDLNLRNIILDTDGHPYVMGFGLSVKGEDYAEPEGTVVGTGLFVPPEVWAGAALGPQGDVWNLGTILYEVLTGYGPLVPEGLLKGVRAQPEEPGIVPPRERDPTIPSQLEEICLRCLEKEPSDRYQTAGELADELRRWKHGKGRGRGGRRRLFVSHSSEDRKGVERRIVSFLERNGVETWYSRVDIQAGEDWKSAIDTGLRVCDLFLVAMSPQAAESEWVRYEVGWAITERTGKIIPALLKTCDPRKIHPRLERIQFVDFRGLRLSEPRGELLTAVEAT